MRREAAIDEAFVAAGGFFGVAAEEDDELAAPAEAGDADGEGGGFVGAEVGEELVNAGFGEGVAVVVYEGDEAIYSVYHGQAMRAK